MNIFNMPNKFNLHGTAWKLECAESGQVLDCGIVRNMCDNIYPGQTAHQSGLDLPSEIELQYADKIKGTKLTVVSFVARFTDTGELEFAQPIGVPM